MKPAIIKKRTVFPATRQKVFFLLQQPKMLHYIAKPYATFSPISGKEEPIWQADKSFAYHFKLFGIISLGVHIIRIMTYSPNEVYTNESNPFVPIWNHRIVLREINRANTEYTDEVEIGAGWKTPFIYLWAKAFYAHRQRKWQKLLRKNAGT